MLSLTQLRRGGDREEGERNRKGHEKLNPKAGGAVRGARKRYNLEECKDKDSSDLGLTMMRV